jgi:hypothetical protein
MGAYQDDGADHERPGIGVIVVRTLALGGAVKAVTARRSRWRSALRRL